MIFNKSIIPFERKIGNCLKRVELYNLALNIINMDIIGSAAEGVAKGTMTKWRKIVPLRPNAQTVKKTILNFQDLVTYAKVGEIMEIKYKRNIFRSLENSGVLHEIEPLCHWRTEGKKQSATTINLTITDLLSRKTNPIRTQQLLLGTQSKSYRTTNKRREQTPILQHK